MGGRLKEVRKKKKVSLEQAEHITRIKIKYLEALEKDDVNAFPSRIYALGFARRYGDFLGFEVEKIEEDFRTEFGSTRNYSLKEQRGKSIVPHFLITPKLIITTIIFIVVAGIITYIGLSVSRLSTPPSIDIISPNSEAVDVQQIVIEGKTQDTAVVEINGQLVTVDDSGQFSQKVELTPGVNIFEIVAKNRLGRESHKTKKILYPVTATPHT